MAEQVGRSAMSGEHTEVRTATQFEMHTARCERDDCSFRAVAQTADIADRAAHRHCIVAGHTVIREERWRLL